MDAEFTIDLMKLYRAIYEYDERSQLARERYEEYDSINQVMVSYLDATYQYDLAGNITRKTFGDGTYLAFTYSIGYQMTQVTNGTATWTFSYDANGNMTQRSLMGFANFQATYDQLNKLVSYRFASIGNYNTIEYDGIGRVWKRTDTSSNNSYFYHTGTALAQELDASYNVTTDYMAGKRRYMPSQPDATKYRYYVKDNLGSVVMMTDHEQNKETYTYDAWGEHVDTANIPTTPNKVRYGGAWVEAFATGTVHDAIHLCFGGSRCRRPIVLNMGSFRT